MAAAMRAVLEWLHLALLLCCQLVLHDWYALLSFLCLQQRELKMWLTLQVEGEGPLVQPQYGDLHRQLWHQMREALLRSQPEAAEATAAAKEMALRKLPELQEQPDWIQQGQLYPHQLAVSHMHPCFLPCTSCFAMPWHASLPLVTQQRTAQ